MASELVADLFVSVDGYAGSDGLPGYFGYFGPELERWMGAESAKPHTALMGRTTYEILAGLPEQHRDESWFAMTRLPTVVFSRTLQDVQWPNATICSQDLVGHVARLKSSGTTPLRTTGSLSVVRQLLTAGLVDRLRLATFPLLAGPAGRERWCDGSAAVELDVVDTRLLDGRVQVTQYRPTGRDIPRGAEQREPAHS